MNQNKTNSTVKDEKNELCDSFRKILHMDKEPIQEVLLINFSFHILLVIKGLEEQFVQEIIMERTLEKFH